MKAIFFLLLLISSTFAKIAEEISCASTREEVLTAAIAHGLISEDGRLPETIIPVRLKNGMNTTVRIVGIAQDLRRDGKCAGITFGFVEPICEASVNIVGTNEGGWERSTLRQLLNHTYLADLIPDEISAHICEVRKMTNNVGETLSPDSVTETWDRLWLFSRRELCGTWHARDIWHNQNAPLYDQIADREGYQYWLFEELGVDDPYGLSDIRRQQPIVVRQNGAPCAYWLRSPDPDNHKYFGLVAQTGEVKNGESAANRYAVVPGFCF